MINFKRRVTCYGIAKHVYDIITIVVSVVVFIIDEFRALPQ